VLATLRKRGLQTHVLILTARDAIEDRVEGLDKGADDYLVKPFAFSGALWREFGRSFGAGGPNNLPSYDLLIWKMDVMTRSAKRRGQYVELTGREFELLEYLLRHKGQVVSREMLGARCVEGNSRDANR